ncbi:hypothetical protein [Candidatus Lokiarchaeum ossiferum]|uniref:hypothetical protein n=1 Tax=Candidatus Lokiarchaeum ossiferum TaxID=2951803 RepID=UPI00352D1E71
MVNGEAKVSGWNAGLAERYIPPFQDKWGKVGPKHSAWHERVKLEIISLSKYVTFLKSELPRPWFLLKPDANPRYNFSLWKGHLQIPSRPEIRFDMVILLNSEYPRVIPRCLLEKNIANYCGKIYLKNSWKDPQTGKEYVMICHDHMAELANAWESNLGIVHFFIREVWFWFAAMQNIIIKNWDKTNDTSTRK